VVRLKLKRIINKPSFMRQFERLANVLGEF
jgi:hypothetical protein